MNHSRDNAKNKLYRNQNKKRIVIEKTAKRARNVLTEPKTDVKEKYVQKTKIHSKPTLKRKLLHAFRSSRKPLADKIKPNDFGKSRHTASSEPFFYDQSYAMVRHTSPIAVDSNGRCVIAVALKHIAYSLYSEGDHGFRSPLSILHTAYENDPFIFQVTP